MGPDQPRETEKDLIEGLEKLGIPVLTVDQVVDKLVKPLNEEIAYYKGIKAACRFLLQHGVTQSKVELILSQTEAELQKLEKRGK